MKAFIFHKISAVILSIVLVILFCPLTVKSLDSSIDWQEITSTKDGKQLWDKQSIKIDKGGILNIKSEFIPKSPLQSTDNLSIVYDMRIDCKNRLFQDTSVNGQIGNNPIWLPDGGDIFIKATIDKVCSSISNN
tara:strand:+ start:243 stop:644 length:402 start_codon:yes stop_codon:yes gene_type:complete